MLPPRVFAPLAALGLLVSACSDDASGEAAGADEAPDDGIDPADRTPRPSAGCELGNATPPRGSNSLALSDGTEGTYLVITPSGYDGVTPLPLGFAFHGANNSGATCRTSNCGGVAQALEPRAVTIYMDSFGTSWTDAERDHNVRYFDELLAHAKANYCVDERLVFAVGTSSGAHFANILGCRRPGDLLAIIPGAGERLEKASCQSARVAALVLHGVDDESVPFAAGEEARDHYAMQNGCSTTTEPSLESVHQMVRDARDGGEETYACADFQGCDEGLPVRWCEHGFGGYDGTTHGWPMVGGELTWDFVSQLF